MTLLETHQTTISRIRTVFLSEIKSKINLTLHKHCPHIFDDYAASPPPALRRSDSRIHVLQGVSNGSEIASTKHERQVPSVSIRFRITQRRIVRPHSPKCKPSISIALNAAPGRTTRLKHLRSDWVQHTARTKSYDSSNSNRPQSRSTAMYRTAKTVPWTPPPWTRDSRTYRCET
jgi:hypothetical protein